MRGITVIIAVAATTVLATLTVAPRLDAGRAIEWLRDGDRRTRRLAPCPRCRRPRRRRSRRIGPGHRHVRGCAHPARAGAGTQAQPDLIDALRIDTANRGRPRDPGPAPCRRSRPRRHGAGPGSRGRGICLARTIKARTRPRRRPPASPMLAARGFDPPAARPRRGRRNDPSPRRPPRTADSVGRGHRPRADRARTRSRRRP